MSVHCYIMQKAICKSNTTNAKAPYSSKLHMQVTPETITHYSMQLLLYSTTLQFTLGPLPKRSPDWAGLLSVHGPTASTAGQQHTDSTETL